MPTFQFNGFFKIEKQFHISHDMSFEWYDCWHFAFCKLNTSEFHYFQISQNSNLHWWAISHELHFTYRVSQYVPPLCKGKAPKRVGTYWDTQHELLLLFWSLSLEKKAGILNLDRFLHSRSKILFENQLQSPTKWIKMSAIKYLLSPIFFCKQFTRFICF